MKTTNTVRMWKQLEDNIYEVSEDGQVRNTKTGRILNQSYNNKYYQVVINKIAKSVHRLVALAFVPNLENKPCVDHIDRNKLNNHKDNLRWVTHSENNHNQEWKGVEVRGNSYRARLKYEGKWIALGSYKTLEEAKAVYTVKKNELCGEYSPFANK